LFTASDARAQAHNPAESKVLARIPAGGRHALDASDERSVAHRRESAITR
jgi:hypothetical protein